MIFQLQDLDKYTASLLPDQCRGCGWWQNHDDGWPSAKEAHAWAESAIETFGAWGKLALGDDRLMGMVQFGPAGLFARARRLPGGPVSDGAVLLACGAVAAGALESVRKSLVTAALAEMSQRGVETVEAFCTDGAETDSVCRFFSSDFLRECGFYPVRSSRNLRLMRLEMGGIQPVESYKKPRRGLLERIKSRSAAPAPVAMAEAITHRTTAL